MTDVATKLGLGGLLDSEELVAFLQSQRWFNGRSRPIVGMELVDAMPLPGDDLTWLVLLGVKLDAGAHDVYQLVLGAGDSAPGDEISARYGHTVTEASEAPDLARLLAAAPADGLTLTGSEGSVEVRGIGPRHDANVTVRPLGLDQSNTSLVVGERLLVKMYRRLEAGLNPELEMLLYLTEHDFAHVPHAAGWYSYSGTQLRATLGIAQRFLPDARDGWSLGLRELPADADRFLNRIARLGAVVGEMHRALAADSDDPAFGSEAPTPETAGLLNATIEDQVEDLYADLPDDEMLADLAGRAEELRDLVRSLTPSGATGRLIRTHGDLHLGQVLWADGYWYVTDFEGEPDRPIAERRKKMMPLRDVAGLFRSFAYLSFTMQGRGVSVGGFEARARALIMGAYREALAGTGLLPPTEAVQERLLEMFELEKVLYELRYELQHRPDWVAVPMAGLLQFLDGERT